MRSIHSRIPQIAKSRRTTLISGPTGSGKEVVAARLHAAAFPEGAPYVPVHCGALPDSLIESELFGHTRGAFTGATQAREGLIRSADGGTLFLDEIDSLPLSMQSKLLRFLESGEYRMVGSDRTEKSSVWVLAATNADLERRVVENRFREDLLFRLDVMRLDLPALRMRGEDVDLLARYFLDRLQDATGTSLQFSDAALVAMRRHSWPGNVRELKHKVERAALLGQGALIEPEDLGLGQPVAKPADDRVLATGDLWSMVEREGMTL
ncbi:MAG: sigma-54-dependent Fis family transcriptional regulator, partial [Myxococcales bacterium]|nr:sigma-54-dependent Fis family transcriptional regulator [Myxococcales bacterium]